MNAFSSSTAATVGSPSKHVGDDHVRLDERPQHAEGEERLELLEQLVGMRLPRRAGSPTREPLVEVGGERLAERLALLEEEVELQQVAQSVGLVPERVEAVAVRHSDAEHQRELGDRAGTKWWRIVFR